MVKCPYCQWQGKIFLDFGIKIRHNAQCPKCKSLERHRLYYLYLKEKIREKRKYKVLHVAPEKILTDLLYFQNTLPACGRVHQRDIMQVLWN